MEPSSRDVVWHESPINRDQRWGRFGLRGATIWLTGISGSGKSTIADALAAQLLAAGRPFSVLDGDNVRHGLNADLGFSDNDRNENVRRLGEVSLLMADAGLVVVVAAVSPFRAGRDAVQARHAAAGLSFVEVFVDTPSEVCAERDPKSLYAKAKSGEIAGLTGLDGTYEPPVAPSLRIPTRVVPPLRAASEILNLLPEPRP